MVGFVLWEDHYGNCEEKGPGGASLDHSGSDPALLVAETRVAGEGEGIREK